MDPVDKIIADPEEPAKVFLDKLLLRIENNPSFLAYFRGASVQDHGLEVHVVFMRLPDEAVETLPQIIGCSPDFIKMFQYTDDNQQELIGAKITADAWKLPV